MAGVKKNTDKILPPISWPGPYIRTFIVTFPLSFSFGVHDPRHWESECTELWGEKGGSGTICENKHSRLITHGRAECFPKWDSKTALEVAWKTRNYQAWCFMPRKYRAELLISQFGNNLGKSLVPVDKKYSKWKKICLSFYLSRTHKGPDSLWVLWNWDLEADPFLQKANLFPKTFQPFTFPLSSMSWNVLKRKLSLWHRH